MQKRQFNLRNIFLILLLAVGFLSVSQPVYADVTFAFDKSNGKLSLTANNGEIISSVGLDIRSSDPDTRQITGYTPPSQHFDVASQNRTNDRLQVTLTIKPDAPAGVQVLELGTIAVTPQGNGIATLTLGSTDVSTSAPVGTLTLSSGIRNGTNPLATYSGTGPGGATATPGGGGTTPGGFVNPFNGISAWDEAISGCTSKGYPSLGCLPAVFVNLINGAVAFAGTIALFMIILGGYRYINSKGDPVQAAQAKKTMTFAIVGLIIVFLSFFAINFISDVTGVECIQKIGFVCE